MTGDQARQALGKISLPLGWTNVDWPAPGEPWATGENVVAAIMVLAGWGLTIFALTLGAPFWFDVLNKIIVVRATVKPTEKSPDEPSKDAAAPSPHVPGGPAASPPQPLPAGAAVIESHAGVDAGDFDEIQALDPHLRPRDDEHVDA